MKMLKNKVVVITGGCGLLGQAIVKEVVNHGGTIIIGDINKEIGLELEKRYVPNVKFYQLDTSSITSIKAVLNSVLKEYKAIDAAIHSAYPRSKQWGTRFEDIQPQHLKDDLFNQLGGAILFSQQILKIFKDQKYGNLIQIASILGLGAPKFNHYKDTNMVSPLEYSVIKSGVINMVRYLSKYYKGNNIKVNAVSLGGLLNNQPKQFLTQYKNDCNDKGMLDPKDIIGTIVFLLSEQSEYINGQNIIVDDGWSL